MLELTTEQNDFLSAQGNIVLHACPGSGKTTMVAKKMLKYIDNWAKPHQGVAVLTFTNVASEEIKRQATELNSNKNALDYPHFIGTIDSFINNYILLRFGYLLFEPPKRPQIVIKNIFSLPFSYWRSECHRNGCVENIDTFKWEINGQLLKN